MQATLDVFRYFFNHLPPLVPDMIKKNMYEALEHFTERPDTTREEVERVMISFGYEIWPYNQAFREVLTRVERDMGEKFLVPKLSIPLQQKYADFKAAGGKLEDLHRGSSAQFFSSEERVELCQALVEMQQGLSAFARQEVMGAGEKHFKERVAYYKAIIATIKGHLDELRDVADLEEEHPALSTDIRSHIRSFEEGLCLLGGELSYTAVCETVEYYKGRKDHYRHFKHLYTPQTVAYFPANIPMPDV